MKFDITQQELLVDPPDQREVYHRYGDAMEPVPKVACYSVNEVLAEKTRALYEREGRARDVYDVVHISRNFRNEVDAARALQILKQKFAFKNLPEPSVDVILARIDLETLQGNWDHQLAHQLPVIPPAEAFFDDLREAIAWWMEPAIARPSMASISNASDERPLPREHFPSRVAAPLVRGMSSGAEGSAMDRIRYAARSRLLAEVTYDRVTRVVEPYSIRTKNTGNRLLYVWEVTRGASRTNHIKAFKLHKIRSVRILEQPFTPRYAIEL